MNRPMSGALLTLVLVSVCAAPLFAAEGADRRNPPVLKKDPVAMAFALPKGMVLTPKEYEWAANVRNQLEPQLRSALDRVKNAENGSKRSRKSMPSGSRSRRPSTRSFRTVGSRP